MVKKGAIVEMEHGRYTIPDKSNLDMIFYLYTRKAMHILQKNPDTNHISIRDLPGINIDDTWEELQEDFRQMEEEREKSENSQKK